jgi:transposase
MSTLVCIPLEEQAGWSKGAQPQAGEPVILAIDVSRSKWVYCLRWGGQEQRQVSTPGELRHLQALVRKYASSQLHVVYEACGFGFEIAWWLQEQQIDVMVIAPSKVERAPGRRVKTDRIDAAKMALKREQGQLKGIYVPSRPRHEDRQLGRTYVQTIKDRRREQTRIRSLLQEHGRLGPPPAAGWAPYRAWLENQQLPAPVASSVRVLLALRESADRNAKEIKREILAIAKHPPYSSIIGALTEQAGVGPFSAMLLVLELITMTRFRSGQALAHYLGVTPSEYTSGPIVRRGPILKCGPGVVRALLVQCAWRSIRRDQGDPKLRALYDRLKPKAQSKRAIIAVARQLAVSLYARWTSEETPLVLSH